MGRLLDELQAGLRCLSDELLRSASLREARGSDPACGPVPNASHPQPHRPDAF